MLVRASRAAQGRGEQGARSLLLLLLKHFFSAKLVFHSIKWNLHLRWASNQCFTNPAAALHFAELAQIMGRVPAGSSQFNPGRPVPTRIHIYPFDLVDATTASIA